jgi:hypothetical protein
LIAYPHERIVSIVSKHADAQQRETRS